MLNIIKVLIFTQKDSLQGMIRQCSDLKKTVSIIMQSDPNVKTSDAKKKKKKVDVLSESTTLRIDCSLRINCLLLTYTLI